MANAAITMDELLALEEATLKQVTQGEVIDGKVLTVRKHEILIDLGPQGIGLVPRREVGFSRALNEGDEVTASIVDAELASQSSERQGLGRSNRETRKWRDY